MPCVTWNVNRNPNPTLTPTKRYPDYHQNLTGTSVAYVPPFDRISRKSAWQFLRSPVLKAETGTGEKIYTNSRKPADRRIKV